jgi:tRNA G18 (ribose-2'-O)-methylase SpoU
MRNIVIIAHDIRSTHNVGSLLRTADGLGVSKVYFTGYTPYPQLESDERLPHMAQKLGRQIAKTALGAEKSVNWEHRTDVRELINNLKRDGYTVAALEQSTGSQRLHEYVPTEKTALLLGREVEGIEDGLLALCDITLEIPMLGSKESLNVVQAAAMALFSLRFA